MTPEQSAAIARIKPIAVEFFRWWWNTVGSNTEQGFDTWAAGPGATLLSALEEAQAVRADSSEYRRGIEDAAKACEREEAAFLSPEYASNQPLGSLTERFACEECAKAIRALTPGDKP